MPIARFQMPDGKVARFEVPEGTTPEQAQAMVEKEFPNLARQAPAEPSLSSRIKRQVGLTARAGIENVTAIPAMLANAPAAVYNTVADMLQPQTLSGQVTGDRGFRFPEQGGAVRGLLTRLGFPEAENAGERVAGDVTGAMAGQAAISKAGTILAKHADPAIRKLGELLARNVQSQVIGAAGAAGGAGTTREAGGGPVAQTVAGLIGGVVAPVAADATIEAAKAAGRGVRAAVEPFTHAGREKIVGSALNRFATDSKQAIGNIDAAQQGVPGSAPTTAQAARDEGLLIAERGVASANPEAGAKFARRASEQNQARTILLDSMAGDEAALEFAKANRAGTAEQLYGQAREIGIDASKLTPARRGEITKLLQRPAIRDAMKSARELAANEGVKLNDPAGSIKGLDYVKRALDDKINAAQGNEQRVLIDLKNRFLTTVDTLSPEYAAARKVFADMSAPVNQMETLQGLRAQVQNAGTYADTGERIMSAAKFANVLRKPESRADLQKVLTKEQFANLEAISSDLDRAALSASSGKAAGSNTTQNISTAYVLGRALGGDVADNAIIRNLSRPLQWLNKLNEKEIQELLTDAMLNPATAKALMARPTASSVESLGFELMQRARAKGIGAAIGTATTLNRPEEKSRSKGYQAAGSP